MTVSQYDRAELIVEDLIAGYNSGDSISKMATRHGLRREAIATVLNQRGLGISTPAREAVLDYVRKNPGLSVDDLSLRLDMSKSSVSRYLRGTDEQKLVVSRKQTDLSRFSDDEMAAALRTAWKELAPGDRGLSRVRYNKLMKPRGAPAASTYIRRYGSWSESCRRAGITAAKPRRASYSQEFSNDDIIEAVADFIDETGETTYHAYAMWAREHKRPSGPLLIMRWTSWAHARREVIRRASAPAA